MSIWRENLIFRKRLKNFTKIWLFGHISTTWLGTSDLYNTAYTQGWTAALELAQSSGTASANAARPITIGDVLPPGMDTSQCHAVSKGGIKFFYCWTHGLGRNKEHTSATCNRKSEGHKTDATLDNMMGGSNTIVTRSRRNRSDWGRGEPTVCDRDNPFPTVKYKNEPSQTTGPPTDSKPHIVDTGTTGNFVVADMPLQNCRTTSSPISIENPNGTRMHSTHEGELPLNKLPPEARRAHRVPALASYSLISVPQLCDAGCDVIFSADSAKIINKSTQDLLYTAHRDGRSRLWILHG